MWTGVFCISVRNKFVPFCPSAFSQTRTQESTTTDTEQASPDSTSAGDPASDREGSRTLIREFMYLYIFYKWPSPRYVTALSHQLRRHTTMQKRIYTLPSFVIGYNYVLIKQLKVVQNVESLL